MRGVQAEQQTLYREALSQVFPGSSVIESEALSGGIASSAMRWMLRLPDGTVCNLVLRTTPWDNPEVALSALATQARVLHLAADVGIKVPRVRAIYPKPSDLHTQPGVGLVLSIKRPTIILDYVRGAPYFSEPMPNGMIVELAKELAKVHRVTATTHDLTFLPERWRTVRDALEVVPAMLDESLSETQIRHALTAVVPRRQNPNVLLHGDYWPGNVLWRESGLVAVIDWEESEWGDPLADLAVARLDLLWAFGAEAMHQFTTEYFARTRFASDDLSWWDLVAALRPMSRLESWATAYIEPPISRPDITADAMRAKHRWFAGAALRQLGF